MLWICYKKIHYHRWQHLIHDSKQIIMPIAICFLAYSIPNTVRWQFQFSTWCTQIPYRFVWKKNAKIENQIKNNGNSVLKKNQLVKMRNYWLIIMSILKNVLNMTSKYNPPIYLFIWKELERLKIYSKLFSLVWPFHHLTLSHFIYRQHCVFSRSFKQSVCFFLF